MKSAQRTIDIVELLASRERPLDAMVISRLCSIPKSSTYHLLALLRDRGWLTYDKEARGWRLGEQLRQLGSTATSISDGIAVLRAFGGTTQGLDLREIARASGMEVRLAARTLEILEAEELVYVDESGTYTLGLRLVTLSARLGGLEELRNLAHSILVDLRNTTGETANILIRHQERAVYLDQAESRHRLRYTGWTGLSFPIEGSASGLALTGAEGPQVVRDAVEPGVTAIAHRIWLPSTGDFAAISVIGPSTRLSGESLDATCELVVTAAASLEQRLSA